MRVAVIGGTGFVGSHIIDTLDDAGYELSVLVRQGNERKLARTDLFRTVRGDLDSPQALNDTLMGCDAVVYCVGILREFRSRGITFEALHYEGVVTTIAAAKNYGVKRLLLMSANGVKIPGTPYQESKKRADDFALASGLETTVFRPSVVFGDPRGRMEFATQLYRDMIAPPLPALDFFTGRDRVRGQVRMSPVHVRDVAQAFLAALMDRSTIGQVYALGGPEVLSWTTMIRRIGDTVGRNKWILPMPIGIMRAAASCFDWLPFFPVTRDQLTMLAEGNTADPAIIESLIRRPLKPFTQAHLAYLRA